MSQNLLYEEVVRAFMTNFVNPAENSFAKAISIYRVGATVAAQRFLQTDSVAPAAHPKSPARPFVIWRLHPAGSAVR